MWCATDHSKAMNTSLCLHVLIVNVCLLLVRFVIVLIMYLSLEMQEFSVVTVFSKFFYCGQRVYVYIVHYFSGVWDLVPLDIYLLIQYK